jgi:cytochrome c oxidase subunit 4
MAEDRPHASVATYLKVAAILAIITALEFGVIYIRRLAPIIVPLLLVMSAAKFAMVALFFMHLRYEGRGVTTLFVGPLLIAVGFVVAMLTLRGAFLLFAR